MSVRHLGGFLRWGAIETLEERIRAIENKLQLCGEAGKPVHAYSGAHRTITLIDGKFVAGADDMSSCSAGGLSEELALRRHLQKVNELSAMIISDMDRCRSTPSEDERLQNLEQTLDKAAELRSRLADCFAACAATSPKRPLPGNAANTLRRPQLTRPSMGKNGGRISANAGLFPVYGVPVSPAGPRTGTAAVSARGTSAVVRKLVSPLIRHAPTLRRAKFSDARGARPASAPVDSTAAATSAAATTGTAAPESATPSSPGESLEGTGGTHQPCGESCTDTPFAGDEAELGNYYTQGKRYDEAVRVYSEAIERDPTNNFLLCNRAAAYMQINHYTLALMDCECVIQSSPHNLKAHWRAAKALVYLNRVQEAKRHYRAARELCVDPEEKPLVEEEARAVQALEKYYVHIKQGRWEDGVCCAAELLRVFGSTGISGLPWHCLKNEAMLHIDAWRALEEIKGLRDSYPNYTELLFLHAKSLFYCLHDAKSTSEVRELLRRASLQKEKEGASEDSRYAHLEQTVALFERYRNMGNTAYNNGKWTEAHAAYTRCLGIDPLNKLLMAVTYCNRAATCMQDMRWDDALMDIHRSIHINGNNAKAYARRARIYLHFTLGQAGKETDYLELAIADLSRAVELAPKSEYNRRLAEAMRLKKDREDRRASVKADCSGCSQRPHTARGSRSAAPQPPNAKSHVDCQRRQRQRKAGGPNVTNARECVRNLLAIGIDGDTEPEAQTVAKAYREAALRWHPDKWVTAAADERWMAEQKFKEINMAYQSLKESMTQC